MEAARNKKVRGWIVRILERAYPDGLEENTLLKQLNDLGYSVTSRDMRASLTYLKEDGFVDNPKFNGFDALSNEFYKLTTKGIDLAEKTIADTGVDL